MQHELCLIERYIPCVVAPLLISIASAPVLSGVRPDCEDVLENCHGLTTHQQYKQVGSAESVILFKVSLSLGIALSELYDSTLGKPSVASGQYWWTVLPNEMQAMTAHL